MNMNKHIAIAITEGRVIRDLFYNGLPEMLFDRGYSIEVFTPAARVPGFINKWQSGNVNFYPLKPNFLDKNGYRVLAIRKMFLSHFPSALSTWSKFENKWMIKPDLEIVDLLKIRKTQLVVITNPLQQYEMPVFGAAQALGIPTLGVVRSWDNLYKGLRVRPDILAVWNPVNREEATRLMKYPPEKVAMIGATQFDAYFDPAANWTRQEFAQKFNLDPTRPILTLATLGPFQHQYDETYLMDWLLAAIQSGEIPSNTQVICRLHPASRLEQFLKYQEYSNVHLSYITGYIPSLAWTMTREDVMLVANLLRHSDVVISPGSTITIETAIFDTPTIVPIFHTYQPELGKKQFDQHLSTHFRRLRDLDLVPIVEKSEDLAPAINHALGDRAWYKAQREQLVRDYVHFTDGKSTERLAELMIKLTRSQR